MSRISLLMSQTKCCLSIIVLLLFSAKMMAQIPNFGFENWNSNNQPDNWLVRGITASKSTDKYSGNYALKLQTTILPVYHDGDGKINSLPPSGTEGMQPAFQISSRHTTLNGFYKFTSVNGDSCQFIIAVYKHGFVNPNPQAGSILGFGFICKSTSSIYAPFTVAINYFDSSIIPDSAFIQLSAYKNLDFAGPETYPLGNSTLYVDNLSFDTLLTSVSKDQTDGIPSKYELSQNYPNPFNPVTTIKYSIAKEGNIKLTVYNVIGSKVATIVNEHKPAGSYSVQFDGSNLASGIYLYRLESGNYSAAKKFILMK
jgi:hypothetical protein